MDYEKKYKEALEVAKRKLCFDKAGMVDSFTPNDIYEMFPELKESEDERIRKALINFLHEGNPFKNIKKETRQRWIAWLEKQGEHADFRNKIQIGDKVTRNEDGVLVNLSQLERVAKKQGEQNSACSEEDEKMLNDIIKDLVHPWNEYIPDRIEDEIKWLKNRLKSPRPQTTWKPSDLPHWKKSNLPNHTTTGFNSDYFCHKGYCINYKELFEKLPKDD